MTPEQILAIALSRPSNVEQEKLASELETLDVDDLVSLFHGQEKDAGIKDTINGAARSYGKAENAVKGVVSRAAGKVVRKAEDSPALNFLHHTNAGKTLTLGAGAAGGVALHNKMDEVKGKMEKKSFSITREGHDFDADRAAIRSDAGAQESELRQRHMSLGAKDRRASYLQALRLREGGESAFTARHNEYVEKKHREGKNAYNPLGGALTPSKHERGGTSGLNSRFGEFETGRKFTHEDKRPKKEKEKDSEVENPTFEQKVEMADAWGRELAQGDFEKISAPGLAAMGGAAKAVGRSALTGIAGQSVARNAASGALTGGALGAAKGVIAPGRDQNGNPQSRLGGAARGALGGAAIGGALGAGARAALPHVGSMNNAAGGAVRSAIGKGVNEMGQTIQHMPQQTGGVAGWAQKQVTNAHANAGQMQQQMVNNVKATRAANPGTGAGAKPAPQK